MPKYHDLTKFISTPLFCFAPMLHFTCLTLHINQFSPKLVCIYFLICVCMYVLIYKYVCILLHIFVNRLVRIALAPVTCVNLFKLNFREKQFKLQNTNIFTYYFLCCLLQLSLVQLASTDNANGRSLRLELKKYCPSMQTSFWSCMNLTLEGKICLCIRSSD